jgi:4'-phosphopantetheinyl transferase
LRFRRPLDAQRTLIGHLLVRQVLALPDTIWPMRRNRYGRPCLDRAVNGVADFNLSHSGPWVALACCPTGRVGVDIEVERDVSPDLMRLVYTREEQAALEGRSWSGFRDGFFRQWTLKESFIKAVGCGLSFPLLAFAVGVGAAEEIRLRWTDGGRTASRWRFCHSTSLAPGCHLAVCTDGLEPPRRAWRIRLVVEADEPVFVREPAALDLVGGEERRRQLA